MSIFICTEKQAVRSTKCLIHRKNSNSYGKTLASLTRRFNSYVAEYQSYYINCAKNNFTKAKTYTMGIVQSQLRNIEQIAEDTGADYHQMQHFITESKWDARAVIDHVATDVNTFLPKRKLTGLIIDESGWAKKGNKSVGVGWQYCGNLGKVSNSQVAVFACLSNGDFASMVDARLYLPKDWCDDPVRCDEAGIPMENRAFKTKLELAVDMINQQVENGLSFDFIGADGYYGNDVNFASTIEKLGYLYMVDIHSDQKVYLKRPELILPERKSNRGRRPTRLKATEEDVSMSEYLKTLQNSDWQTLKVRNTAKGKLIGQYHFARVYVWNTATNQIESRMLVIRKTRKGKKRVDINYSFTNANLDQYTPEAIAYMQAQRYFVEHSIKESKHILGIDQFQTRKWKAWHHQVALNFIVSAFILKEKIDNFDDLPLLSARDLKEMLVYQLYQQMTQEQAIDKIFNRHLKRQRDINNSFAKT